MSIKNIFSRIFQINKKIISAALVVAVVLLAIGSQVYAVLTFDATSGTSDAALTLNSAAASNIVIGSASTSGTIAIGGTTTTGLITLGQSTATNEIDIGNANTATGATQTIKIGNGTPVTTGLTAITIGNTFANASAPASTVNLYGKITGDCGTGTASANAVTIQKQCGVITSSTTTLAAVTSETITLTDARIAATNIILATINGGCGAGNVVVENAVAGAGSATIVVRNVHATVACTTAYKIGFLILSQ